MPTALDFLTRQAKRGELSRREFLRRAAALGIAAPFAGSLLTSQAFASASTPQRGGILKAGMQGGESTDSLDPASWTSQVQHSFGQSWGEALTNVSPEGELVPRLAESVEPSSDART